MCGTLLKAGHDDFLLSRKAFISTGNSRVWQHRIYTHTRPRPPTAHSHTAVAWLYTRQNLIANVCYVVRTKLPSAVWVCLPVYHFSNLKAALKAYAFDNHHELRKCSWFRIRNDFWARPTESTPTGNGQIPTNPETGLEQAISFIISEIRIKMFFFVFYYSSSNFNFDVLELNFLPRRDRL